MKPLHGIAILASALTLSACGDITDKTKDYGINSHHLSQMQAGIWVDPHGCDQWIIDDGAEGYLSARLDRYGKPVCSGIAPPMTVVGKFINWGVDPL